jgi:hypothetical protein
MCSFDGFSVQNRGQFHCCAKHFAKGRASFLELVFDDLVKRPDETEEKESAEDEILDEVEPVEARRRRHTNLLSRLMRFVLQTTSLIFHP